MAPSLEKVENILRQNALRQSNCACHGDIATLAHINTLCIVSKCYLLPPQVIRCLALNNN